MAMKIAKSQVSLEGDLVLAATAGEEVDVLPKSAFGQAIKY